MVDPDQPFYARTVEVRFLCRSSRTEPGSAYTSVPKAACTESAGYRMRGAIGTRVRAHSHNACRIGEASTDGADSEDVDGHLEEVGLRDSRDAPARLDGSAIADDRADRNRPEHPAALPRKHHARSPARGHDCHATRPRWRLRLAQPASAITLADIVRAVDGPLLRVQGLRPEAVEFHGVAKPLRDVWIAVRVSIRTVLESTTIADLVAGQLRPKLPTSSMSSIRAPLNCICRHQQACSHS